MRSPKHGPVDRLLIAYGVGSDARLVERLGSKPQTVSSWRKRGRIPLPILMRASEECGVTADWLLHGAGDGPRAPPNADAAEDPAPYQVGGAPEPEPDGDLDPRLAALLDWLGTWWAAASEEERAWMVVEMRMLRGRLVPSHEPRSR